MCRQHCPWKRAVSLICVRLFVLSKGWKCLYSLSRTPQNSLEMHEAIVAGRWNRRKLDLLNSFNIDGVFSVVHLCPNERVSLPQTLFFECPAITAADLRSPDNFSARALTVLRSTSIFIQTHSFPPLLPPSPICKYCSMHILLHAHCMGYF